MSECGAKTSHNTRETPAFHFAPGCRLPPVLGDMVAVGWLGELQRLDGTGHLEIRVG